jgi:hypothetical protein
MVLSQARWPILVSLSSNMAILRVVTLSLRATVLLLNSQVMEPHQLRTPATLLLQGMVLLLNKAVTLNNKGTVDLLLNRSPVMGLLLSKVMELSLDMVLPHSQVMVPLPNRAMALNQGMDNSLNKAMDMDPKVVDTPATINLLLSIRLPIVDSFHLF